MYLDPTLTIDPKGKSLNLIQRNPVADEPTLITTNSLPFSNGADYDDISHPQRPRSQHSFCRPRCQVRQVSYMLHVPEIPRPVIPPPLKRIGLILSPTKFQSINHINHLHPALRILRYGIPGSIYQ